MNLLIVNDERLTAKLIKEKTDWPSLASKMSCAPTVPRKPRKFLKMNL